MEVTGEVGSWVDVWVGGFPALSKACSKISQGVCSDAHMHKNPDTNVRICKMLPNKQWKISDGTPS